MRAPRAEVRQARQGFRNQVGCHQLLDEGHPLLQVFVVGILQDALSEFHCDVVGVQCHCGRKEDRSGFVVLANDSRCVCHSVECVLELRFDEPALFLNDDDTVQPLCKLPESFRIERPRHSNLEEAQPQPLREPFVNAQLFKREPHIHVRLARGDQAQPRVRGVPDDAVESIEAGKGKDGGQFELVQPTLLLLRGVGPANLHPAFRKHKIFGRDELEAAGANINGSGGFHGVVNALERSPGSSIARKRPADQSAVEDFLHAGGVKNGDHRVHHGKLTLVAGRGRFAGVVIAEQGQHSPQRHGAREIPVAQRIPGAVHSWALAVPHAEHTIVLALAE